MSRICDEALTTINQDSIITYDSWIRKNKIDTIINNT